MQKSKKLLAVLLSLVLALSTMSVAMVAFAAEPAEKPAETLLDKFAAVYEDGKAQLPAEAADLLTFAEGAAKDTYNFAAGAVEDIVAALEEATKDAPAIPEVKAPVAKAPVAKAYEAAPLAEAGADEDTTDYTDANAAKEFLKSIAKSVSTDGRKAEPKHYKNLTKEEVEKALKFYEGLKSVNKLSTAGGDLVQAFRPIALQKFVVEATAPATDPEYAFKKTNVRFPMTANAAKTNKALAALDPILSELIAGQIKEGAKDPNAALAEMLYTNANVVNIANMLYKLLFSQQSLRMLCAYTPDTLVSDANVYAEEAERYAPLKEIIADNLTVIKPDSFSFIGFKEGEYEGAWEERYQKELDAWEADTSADKGARPYRQDVMWDYFAELDNVNFGFKDGDKDGFITALSFVMRSISGASSSVIKLQPAFDTASWDYMVKGKIDYGAYDYIATILEALGADVMPVDKFIFACEEEYFDHGAPATLDAPLRLLLEQVLPLIEKILANPATEIMDLLPNLAFALENGILNDNFKALLASGDLGILGIIDLPIDLKSLELTTDGIFEFIAGIINPDAETKDAVEIAVDETTSITLTKANFAKLIKALAGCGTAEVKYDSVSRRNSAYVDYTANGAEAFATVYEWLQKYITGDVLAPMLYDLVDNAGLPYFVSYKLYLAVYAIATFPSQPAFAVIVNLFVPAFKVPTIVTAEVSIFDIIADLFFKK